MWLEYWLLHSTFHFSSLILLFPSLLFARTIFIFSISSADHDPFTSQFPFIFSLVLFSSQTLHIKSSLNDYLINFFSKKQFPIFHFHTYIFLLCSSFSKCQTTYCLRVKFYWRSKEYFLWKAFKGIFSTCF